MGVKLALKPKIKTPEDISESIDIYISEVTKTDEISSNMVDKLLEKRSDSFKAKWHKIEAIFIKGDYTTFSFKHFFNFGYIDAKILHTIEKSLNKINKKEDAEIIGNYKKKMCAGVIKEFEFFINKYQDKPDIKKIYEEELEKYKEHMGISGDINEKKISEDYNWDELEFGLDNIRADYDDDYIDDIETFDNAHKDEESEFYNYAIEKEQYDDEEVDKLINRYLKIRDANTYQKIKGMFMDFRGAVKEAAKKHGNFVFDTDERDDEKDDVRMMTKSEAIMIVDNVLASKYRMYLLAFESFKRDSSRTVTFTLLTTIFFSCLAISGIVLILPIAAVFATAATVGNFYALFRDLKRTRLVIIKEIERIDNTVERMMKEENPDKEKIKTLLEIKSSLVSQAGYDPKSPKWSKLRDPDVVKKITQMIDYFGESVVTIDDIRINIIEADAEGEASKEEQEVIDEELTKTEGEASETEEEGADEEGEGNADLGDTQDEYLDSDPAEETLDDSDTFDAGGTEKEEAFKLKYCLDNLDTLLDKYTQLYDSIVASDIYKIVNEDIKNKNRDIFNSLLAEFSIALDNLKNYIEVGDKTTYPIVAFKLSVHQNLLRNIDTVIKELIDKESSIEK